MSFRFSSLAAAGLAVASFGCIRPHQPAPPVAADINNTQGQAEDNGLPLPPAQPVQSVPAAKSIKIADQVPDQFRLADGTPNYDALRAAYGEPNTNIVLNPRAVKVSDTTSVNSVKIEADRLVFARADAAWLLNGHGPGDTLYCSKKCGDRGFLRNVTSIRTEGDSVIVETTQGKLTDVIHGGWIHGQSVIGINVPPEQRARFLHDPRTSLINLGNCQSGSDTIQICYSADKSGTIWSDSWMKQIQEPFPGGSLGVYATFTITLNYDINIEVGVGANVDITNGISVDPIFELNLISISATIEPGLQVDASYHVSEAFSKDWTLVDIDAGPSFSLASIIDVDTNVFLSLKAHADASAQVTALVTASTADKLTVGASYSSTDGGFKPIFSNDFTSPTYSFNVNGDAAAHASAAFAVDLGLTIDGAGALAGVTLGGPSLTASGGAGAEFNASANNEGSVCTVNLSGEAYYAFQGNVTLDIGLPGFSFSYPYDFPTLNETFPSGGWKYQYQTNSAVCSQGNFDAGGRQECLPNDGGTKQFLCPAKTPSCCPTGATTYACVDEGTDSNNCGACGDACAETAGAGSTCMNGTCSCTCPSSTPMAGQPCPMGMVVNCLN